jgi:transposase InsO family protein
MLSTYPPEVVQAAVSVKRAHPHWGPANVRLELKHQLGLADEELPSPARLSALFRDACPEAVQPRRRRAYPTQPPPPATYPHQRWQMDGKEKVAIGERDVATVLNIRDPASGLLISSRALLTTTPKGWRKVTLDEVQATLRQAFEEWGLPLDVQTDHEVVYTGSPATDFPSHFTLWLVGLGLTHLTSRERRPTDQSHVERSHRTLGDLTWQDEHFALVEHLQTALDVRRQRYNTEFPSRAADCQGHPPLVVYPQARHSGRPYRLDMEWSLFDLTRVDAFLAHHVWTRQVSQAGNVRLDNHLYFVGRAYARQTVSVRFIPVDRTFGFQLADGTLLGHQPAVGLDRADLIGFLPADCSPVPFQLPLPLLGV